MSDTGKELLPDRTAMQRRRSVRPLIVLVAAISVVILSVAVSFRIRQYYAEKGAAFKAQLAAHNRFAEQVTKIGGKIRYASLQSKNSLELASIDGIDLSGTAADGSLFKTFSGLKNLQRLLLNDTQLQPGDLESVTGLPKLESLSLARTTIGRSDLVCISTLPQLKTLSLTGTSISDTDVEPLLGMGSVTTIDISRTKLTAEATKTLQSLTALETVTLEEQCITPESVVRLSSLKNLQIVEICVPSGLGKESRNLVAGKLKSFVVGINPQGVRLWEANIPWDETLAGVIDTVALEFPLDAKEIERLVHVLHDKSFKRPVAPQLVQSSGNQPAEPEGPTITSSEQFVELLKVRGAMPKSVRDFARDKFSTADIPILVEAVRNYDYSLERPAMLFWWGPYLLVQHGLYDPAAIEQLERLLNHSSAQVRLTSVNALGQDIARQLYPDWIPSEKLVQFAIPQLVRLGLDEYPPVRGSVAEVLGDLAVHHPKYCPQAMTGLVNILRKGNQYSYTIDSISRIAAVNPQAALGVVPELRHMLNDPPDFSKEYAQRKLRPGTLEDSYRAQIREAIYTIAKYSPALALEVVREDRANKRAPPIFEFNPPEIRAEIELLLHELLAEGEEIAGTAGSLGSICLQIRDWRAKPPATSPSN